MNTPTTLDEAVDYLIAHMSEDSKKAYAAGALHPDFYAGMNMRNDWGLWFNTSPLGKFFEAAGIHHGDDRSMVIYETLRARVKGEPYDLKKKAKWFANWWMKRYGLDHTKFGKPEAE